MAQVLCGDATGDPRQDMIQCWGWQQLERSPRSGEWNKC